MSILEKFFSDRKEKSKTRGTITQAELQEWMDVFSLLFVAGSN